jgi:hypothetical protein
MSIDTLALFAPQARACDQARRPYSHGRDSVTTVATRTKVKDKNNNRKADTMLEILAAILMFMFCGGMTAAGLIEA